MRSAGKKTLGILTLLSELGSDRLATAQPLEPAGPAVQTAHQSYIDHLIWRLQQGDPVGRAEAAKTLGELKDPRAVGPLLTALYDPEKGVRLRVVGALGEFDDPRSVEPLIQASVTEPDSLVRSMVVGALLAFDDPRVVDALIKVLKEDRDGQVRSSAAHALGDIRNTQAVDPLISALKDNEYSVRYSAAFALGRLQDRRAVPELLRALQDDYPGVRENAATALKAMKEPIPPELTPEAQEAKRQLQEAERLAQKLVEERDGGARAILAVNLIRLGPLAVMPLIQQLGRPDWLENRKVIVATLGSIGDASVDALINALENRASGRDLRIGVTWALGALGGSRAVEPLSRVLLNSDEDRELRITAAVALGNIRDTKAIDALTTALADPTASVQMAAAGGLVNIGQSAVDPLIHALTSHRDVSIRATAALVLGQIGDAKAILALKRALKDESLIVQRAAKLALERLQEKEKSTVRHQ